MPPTLQGSLVTLRPLLKTDAPLLIDAAEDGELWSLPFTVVPSADTVDSYPPLWLQAREMIRRFANRQRTNGG